jgi:phage tail tube protein FII
MTDFLKCQIDALNNIYKVAGVDKLANFRANLGV